MTQRKITAKDILFWDVANWSEALSFWEKCPEIEFDRAKILEIGSSQGGLSLWAASKGANVICSDLSNPQVTAKFFHEQFEFPGSITYEAIDATDISYENHFDIVIFKSVLGGVGRNNHLERQQKMIDEIHKALKAGGLLLFAENLKASWLHQFARKKFVRWGTQWHYITIDEIQNLCKDKFDLKLGTTGFLGAFGRSENQRYFLSLLDNALFSTIVTENSNYIVFGAASKL